MAEEHAPGGDEEQGEGEAAVQGGLAGSLPGEQAEGGEGEEKGVGAGVGGKLSGEARQKQGSGAEAEGNVGPAADEPEEKEHRGCEGEDLRQTACESGGPQSGDADAAEQVAERGVQIDELNVGEELPERGGLCDVEGKEFVVPEEVRGALREGCRDVDRQQS